MPKEHSGPIEKRMSGLMPLRILNIRDTYETKVWFHERYGFREYIKSCRSQQRRKNMGARALVKA